MVSAILPLFGRHPTVIGFRLIGSSRRLYDDHDLSALLATASSGRLLLAIHLLPIAGQRNWPEPALDDLRHELACPPVPDELELLRHIVLQEPPSDSTPFQGLLLPALV